MFSRSPGMKFPFSSKRAMTFGSCTSSGCVITSQIAGPSILKNLSNAESVSSGYASHAESISSLL